VNQQLKKWLGNEREGGGDSFGVIHASPGTALHDVHAFRASNTSTAVKDVRLCT
jgi:hypothetical protein